MTDSLTILHTPHLRLAKLVRADGSIIGYDNAKHFDLAELAIADLDHLARILTKLLNRPACCIVRGAIADPARVSGVRRLVYPCRETGEAPTLLDVSRQWISLDVDGVVRPDHIPAADLVACAQVAIALLPTEFRKARCIAQATSAHGLKPGSRLRLWFWADRQLSGAELSAWMRGSPVDGSIFRPCQPIYTAAPIFQATRDHLPSRIAMIDGVELVLAPPHDVLIPPLPPIPAPPRRITNSDTRTQRMIATALMKVETAGEGQRHYQLRNSARLIGGMLDQAGIGEDQARQALYAAVMRAGGSAVKGQNADATIRWGLQAGRTAPLDIGGRA